MLVLILNSYPSVGGKITSVVATSKSKSKLMDLADMAISEMSKQEDVEFESGWSNNRRSGDSPKGPTHVFSISEVKHLT